MSAPWHSVQWSGPFTLLAVAGFTCAACAPTPAAELTRLPFESAGGAAAKFGSELVASFAVAPGVPWQATQPVRLAFRVTRPFTCVAATTAPEE